ncbi:MAG: zf-HC2 domain-containing protein [Denitromonas halophila]|uniref:Zf-HC2 domain-containing protein n=2 Tax=Denitromonas halophila TaxID=1629404 RepID=A0A557R025_9RHOO|nr:zf-HC2 domain-containing protein [Denitromonas halophila]TVT76148.1 MAG: zf-HC2 domain-containing protein [Denitromonas halophila]
MPMTETCLDLETLSALVDGALTTTAEREARAHVACCPACGLRLNEMRQLSEDFHVLPPTPLGFDLGARIETRLPSRPAPRRRLWGGWSSLVALAGAAAALVLGLRLGMSLVSDDVGREATSPVVLAMSVFDAVPPGNLCPRPEACLLARVSR